MEIKPEIGIGELKFGMKKAEIIKILGNSDSEKTDKEDENRIQLTYNKHRIRLTFYEDENNKLGYILTSNLNLSYNGTKIMNANIDFIKNEVFKNIINVWEIDEYPSFTAHFNEKFWLNLDSEFETVTSFELGVPFENDDEYKWPK